MKWTFGSFILKYWKYLFWKSPFQSFVIILNSASSQSCCNIRVCTVICRWATSCVTIRCNRNWLCCSFQRSFAALTLRLPFLAQPRWHTSAASRPEIWGGGGGGDPESTFLKRLSCCSWVFLSSYSFYLSLTVLASGVQTHSIGNVSSCWTVCCQKHWSALLGDIAASSESSRLGR